MAIPSTTLHTRSISLPLASHPLETCIEEHLQRLRSSQVQPSSSSSIGLNLCDIKHLNEQISDLISLPRSQSALSKECVEKVLEGSLALFDASSFALDALSQMKESILDLQSSLRRGNNVDGIRAYLVSRKNINKMVSKCLKGMEKSCASLENDDSTMRMLKEVEAITIVTLKSVLSYLLGKRTSNWSVVTKLVKSKRVSCESGRDTEVEEIDSTLRSLSEKQLTTESKELSKKIETLASVMNELENGLESVSRCLVKTRVSLLNLVNH